MTTAIHDNCYTCWNGCSTDASDKRGCLSSNPPDAYGVGLSINTSVAYIDIVAARSEIYPGFRA
jgi:hypothetical protein